jgi:hypothetical protein
MTDPLLGALVGACLQVFTYLLFKDLLDGRLDHPGQYPLINEKTLTIQNRLNLLSPGHVPLLSGLC